MRLGTYFLRLILKRAHTRCGWRCVLSTLPSPHRAPLSRVPSRRVSTTVLLQVSSGGRYFALAPPIYHALESKWL